MIYQLPKNVAQWYVVQVSDTTMMSKEKMLSTKLFTFQHNFILLKSRRSIEISILYFFAVIFKEAVPA